MTRSPDRAYFHGSHYARDEANRRIALYEARLRASWRSGDRDDENAASNELKKAERALARAEKEIAKADEAAREKQRVPA